MVVAVLHILGGVLPDGLRVVGVVGHQDLQVSIRRDGAQHIEHHDRDGVIGVHGLRQGDGGLIDGLGKGHGVGGAVRLGVIGHHLDGVGPVEDFLPVGGGDTLDRVALPQGGGVGPLEHIVQVLFHRHGVAVSVRHRVGQVKAVLLGPQIGAGGRGAGDDRDGVVVHRPGFAGHISAGGVVAVIGAHTVGHGVPPGGDGVGVGQGGALIDLGPGAAVHLPLQLIAAEVAVTVRGGGPGNGQVAAATDHGGDGQTAGSTGGPVVGHRHRAAGFPAALKSGGVIGLDPVGHGVGAKGHGVGGAGGGALIDLGPGAAVRLALDNVALKVALCIRGGAPAHGDGAAAVNTAGDGDAGGRRGGGVLKHRAVIAHIEVGGESESGAGPAGAGAEADADIAIGAQVDGVVGDVRARGAGPLDHGGAIQLGNLIIGCIGQRCALLVKPAFVLAQLIGGQQEHRPVQGAHCGVTITGSVTDFRGANQRPDVSVQHVFVGAVEPAVNSTGCVGVHIGSVPLPLVIAVLAENQGPPGSVEAAFVVMHANIKLHQLAVFFELDDGACGLTAKGGCGH